MAEKWKGKEWYEITAPKMFNNKKLGVTPTSDPEELKGRTIEIGLNRLVPNTSKYFYKMKFQINEINGNKANTKFIGHSVSRDIISRMVRRGVRRVDARIETETKDKKKIIVKIISVTLKRVTSSVKNSVRKVISNTVKETVSKLNFDEFVGKIIKDEFQNQIRSRVSKTYPLRGLEINKTEVKG